MAIALTVLMTSTSVGFAANVNEKVDISNMKPEISAEMTDIELVNLAEKYGELKSDDVRVIKLNNAEKKLLIEDNDNVDLSKSDVYFIDRELSEETGEQHVIAEIEVMAAGNTGEVSENGTSARVVANCVIGYSKKTFEGVQYRKGEYYGGKIVSQPISSAITSIKGTYVEGGAYVTANNQTGTLAKEYKTSTTFDLKKHTTLQKKTVSRTNYYSTEMPFTILAAKYEVAGTVNGNNPFSFDVNAFAIGSKWIN